VPSFVEEAVEDHSMRKFYPNHKEEISFDTISDITEKGGKYIIITRDGKRIPLEKEIGRRLYWEVKIRNRRKVFGLL